ncbi:IS4 family transposase [Aphanothece sacrum]|uniref:IS4 family transposase n=1 Tax=Aphanothece sacrum TaxID=1122 RepID=UPI000FF9B224|nr:transposase, IS4 family [Aphanothece sacrum FPU3]
MLPEIYNNHLTKYLKKSEYLILLIMIELVQVYRKIRFYELASYFPSPILFESKRKKLKRFFEIPCLTIEGVWIPIIKQWLKQSFSTGDVLHIAIDRTQWGLINILMVSLVIDNRGIPLYFELLDHIGNSNFDTQKSILARILLFLKEYKIVVLGDREFCSVELAKWLHGQKRVYYALRLKKSNYIEVEKEMWTRLKDLGLSSGMSLFYQGVKVTKTKGFIGSNIVAKWKKKYRGIETKEAWFIITNLTSIDETIDAYKKRFCIEEMFRDFKKGGYDLERTKLTGHRLTSLIILITLAYSMATFSGKIIKEKGLAKYVGRVRKNKKMRRRHSNFYIGLHGKDWVDSCDLFTVEAPGINAIKPRKTRLLSTRTTGYIPD